MQPHSDSYSPEDTINQYDDYITLLWIFQEFQ